MTHRPKSDVCSEPVDLDDGETVVICQQNVGPGNQVGGGEFKNVYEGRSPEQVQREQEALERDAPVGDGSESDHRPGNDRPRL
jgi:hypothetical protein